MNMAVESPKCDASIRDLRQIRGVTGDLEIRLASGLGQAARLEIATYSGTNPRS
jgi:hypothetical protein